MKVAGVITEYNPFHNGHKYQLKQIKRQTSADYIVIVMSGDFVQRGEPAIIDKYERTRMALLSGADLVLELPSVFATASAEFFAGGGVSVLKNTGVVDMLWSLWTMSLQSLLLACLRIRLLSIPPLLPS